MWLLLSERRDLLRKEPLSILQRKEVPHLRYTCKFLCMRKKNQKLQQQFLSWLHLPAVF